MKILHVINTLRTGGAEKLVSDTLPFLNGEYQVSVLTLVDESPIFADSLRKRGISVHSLHMSNMKSPLAILRIRRYIRDYDLIHVHLFPTQYWVAMANILLFKNKKILITTEHNTNNRRRSLWFFKYIDRFIYNQYSSIIAISEATRYNLIKYLGNSKSVDLIPNGIDVEIYQNGKAFDRSSLGFSEEDLLLIMVARFSEQKDQATLIRSLLHLSSDIKLVLIGDGKLRNQCELLVEDNNLKDRVVFLGIRKDIPSLLKMADVSVISSNWEGFGLVAVEAMAAGLPVIGSNVEGLADVIGSSGLLFKKGDEIDLAKQIETLYKSSIFRDKVAQTCYNRALSFNIDKMIQSTLDIYNRYNENNNNF